MGGGNPMARKSKKSTEEKTRTCGGGAGSVRSGSVRAGTRRCGAAGAGATSCNRGQAGPLGGARAGDGVGDGVGVCVCVWKPSHRGSNTRPCVWAREKFPPTPLCSHDARSLSRCRTTISLILLPPFVMTPLPPPFCPHSHMIQPSPLPASVRRLSPPSPFPLPHSSPPLSPRSPPCPPHSSLLLLLLLLLHRGPQHRVGDDGGEVRGDVKEEGDGY